MTSTLAIDILARGGSQAAAEMEKVARATDKTGSALKKNSKISDDVAKASARLTKAHNNETTALDRVQIAEQKLAEVRQNGNAKVSQVLTAEKALARARRDAAVAGHTAQKAARDLSKALDDEGKKAGKSVGSGLKKWFTGDGKSIFKQVGEDGGTVFGSGIAGALKTPVLGPAIIAGVGGALATAAPVVGSIAAAGIVGGFGVGLGALGAVFAAKSVAVQNAWNKTLWSMAADMKVISKPFESTLVSMAATAQRTFQGFKPELAAAFKTLAPAFTDFGTQMGKALERLTPAIRPLADAGAAVIKSLGAGLPDIVGKLSNNLIELADSVQKNPTGLRDLASALGSVTDGALKTIKVLNDIDAAVGKLPRGFNSLGDLANKIVPLKSSFDSLLTVIGAVDESLAGTSVNSSQLASIVNQSGAAASAFGRNMSGAASAADQHAGAVAKDKHEMHAANVAAYLLATAFERQAAATQRSIDALNRRSSLLLSLSGAEIDYQQAVDDATQAIKDNGRTHDINTQKGRDNKRALDQVAASAIAQRDAMLKANDGNVKAAKAAETGRAAFVKLAQQMGYTKPQAIAMAQSLIKIPNVTRTAKLQANIADLQSKLSTAKKQLADGSLTKERKAQLKADISDLEAKLRRAKAALADPKLTATKKAQLKAEIADLEAKISRAKTILAAPQLTATKRAKLEAEISRLQAGVQAAKAALAGLPRSRNVSITTTFTEIHRVIGSGSRSSGGGVGGGHEIQARAEGGPVFKGQTYLVGEKRPELFVPDQNGTIVPKLPDFGAMSTGGLPVKMKKQPNEMFNWAGRIRGQLHRLHVAHVEHLEHLNHVNHQKNYAEISNYLAKARLQRLAGSGTTGNGISRLHPDDIRAMAQAFADALAANPPQVALDSRLLDRAMSSVAVRGGY